MIAWDATGSRSDWRPALPQQKYWMNWQPLLGVKLSSSGLLAETHHPNITGKCHLRSPREFRMLLISYTEDQQVMTQVLWDTCTFLQWKLEAGRYPWCLCLGDWIRPMLTIEMNRHSGRISNQWADTADFCHKWKQSLEMLSGPSRSFRICQRWWSRSLAEWLA